MKASDKNKAIKIEYPVTDEIYDHYKGGAYLVKCMAKHSETNETLVIYQSMHFGSFHARPLSMWHDVITIAGKKTKRFKLRKKRR